MENDGGAHGGRAQQQGVAVGIGSDYRGDADNAAATRAIFDDKSLAELLTDLIEQQPRHDVIRGAGGERTHDQDRARRPVLCGGRNRERNDGRSGDRRA